MKCDKTVLIFFLEYLGKSLLTGEHQTVSSSGFIAINSDASFFFFVQSNTAQFFTQN